MGQSADNYMIWFAEHRSDLEHYIRARPLHFDPDILIDAALKVRDHIARTGDVVVNRLAFTAGAYRFLLIDTLRGERVDVKAEDRLDLSADNRDVEPYEDAVFQLSSEIAEYVKTNYSDVDASLFELYIGLLPATSYPRLSKMFGISERQLCARVGRIRKDLRERFGRQHAVLLSLRGEID